MEENDGDGNYCFNGRLKPPGLPDFNAKNKHEIVVFAKPKVFEERPVLAGPESTVVKTCGFFNSGSMSMGFEADRTVLSPNQVLGVTVVARNDSTKAVKELSVALYQETTWFAQGEMENKGRVIASIKVPGSELGAMGERAGKGGDNGHSVDAASIPARNELEHLLRSGAGVRHELVVPEDCFDTMDSELIVVRHLIVVKLKTASFVESPNLWTAAVVHRAGEVVPDAACQPVPVATAATPANPQVLGLDAQGNKPIPVIVPEHSVKLKLNAIPDPSVPSSSEYSM